MGRKGAKPTRAAGNKTCLSIGVKTERVKRIPRRADRGRKLVALRQAAKQLPTSVELRLQLAASAIDAGSHAEAAQILEELRRLD